jgi:hypothetical protein
VQAKAKNGGKDGHHHGQDDDRGSGRLAGRGAPSGVRCVGRETTKYPETGVLHALVCRGADLRHT